MTDTHRHVIAAAAASSPAAVIALREWRVTTAAPGLSPQVDDAEMPNVTGPIHTDVK